MPINDQTKYIQRHYCICSYTYTSRKKEDEAKMYQAKMFTDDPIYYFTSIGDPEQKSKTTTNLTTPSTVWPKQNQRLQCSFFAFGGLRTRSTLLPPIARPSRSWRLALRNDAARLTSNQQHERTSTIRLSREWVRRKEAIKQPYKKDYEWLKNLRLYYYYYCHQFRPCCILQ